MQENLDKYGYGNDLLDTTPKLQFMRKVNAKLDFNKIKNSCSVKVNVKTIRRRAIYWKKIFARDPSDKGVLSSMYKELFKLISKKTSN